MTTLAQRLRAKGCWVGASWLPRMGDEGYLFGAGFDGSAVMLSAIGGKVEPGETFLQAARREYEEETGTSPPTLIPRARPSLFGVEEPLAQAEDTEGGTILIRTMPGISSPHPPALWIMVFSGWVHEQPRPVEKLPAFVLLTPAAFTRVAEQRTLPAGVPVIGALGIDGPTPVVLGETLTALAAKPDVLGHLWQGAEPPSECHGHRAPQGNDDN
jgi:ADP-ribose pyrophosphatase YjhB (NUDIX family)